MPVSQPSQALLRAERLCATRRDTVGVDVTLQSGDRIGILGASGSGKTALLRVLARLDAPISGRLFWGSTDVTRVSRWLMRKRRFSVAMLLANPYASFEPWSPVRAILDGLCRAAPSSTDLLAQGRIPAVAADGRVSALSGVARVRLAALCALQRDARVLLIDDVFRMVVPEMWGQLFSEFETLAGGSRALVVASRYWQALRNVDSLFVLSEGRVVEWGPRESIWANPQHPYTQWALGQSQHRSSYR